MSTRRVEFQQGAVSFLDVLGWKGIWERRTDAQAVFASLFHEIGQGIRGTTTKLISVSDTIALFTEGQPDAALQLHGRVCAQAVCSSIQKKIPLRGATCYGDYTVDEQNGINLMIGPAVDEAASWHEATDWIGMILSPSAYLALYGAETGHWVDIKNHRPPIKGGDKVRTLCLNWCSEWIGDEKSLMDIFRVMGPFHAGVASKYSNTLEFFRASRQDQVG